MNHPCRTALAVALLAAVPLLGRGDGPAIAVDHRIELMSIVFRLAGNPEYNQGKVPAYEKAIASHFHAFRDHEAVRAARALRESRSVSFDAVMSMAIHLSDASELRERVAFSRPGIRLEQRWTADAAMSFVTSLRQFVRDARFASFTDAQRPLYALTNERLRGLVQSDVDLSWFQRFYRTNENARFMLAPGLANGGSSYGPRFAGADGVEEFWSIAGVDTVDAGGLPLFDDRMIPTLLHEFSHSFVNPTVARHVARLEPSGQRVYTAAAAFMKRQAYNNWKTMVDESLVRAAVARYLLEHEGRDRARAALRYEWSRGFLWIDDLFELLGRYEQGRDRYASLDAFMPEVSVLFDSLPARMPALLEQYESSRPRVISMVPENGLSPVSPDAATIVVRFDRPMRNSRSIVVSPACGKACYPEVLSAAFDGTGTIFTMRVRLQPGRAYEFSLNSDTADNFQSRDGIPMRPYVVRFQTAQ